MSRECHLSVDFDTCETLRHLPPPTYDRLRHATCFSLLVVGRTKQEAQQGRAGDVNTSSTSSRPMTWCHEICSSEYLKPTACQAALHR